MIEKIVFLCVNPWEGFLSPAIQSCGKEYFQWICEQALLRNIKLNSGERIEIYGELQGKNEILFSEPENELQILYIQSHREKLLEAVFEQADLVLMGVPGSLRDFDRMFMLVFPWKDQILFLWDQRVCKGDKFLQQLCREYKLREAQMIELKRGLNGELRAGK